MVSKDQDLVKHGTTNLPNYLQCDEGKTVYTQTKAYNFGVLDWSRIEKWKSNAKFIVKTKNLTHGSGPARLSTPVNNNIPQSDQQASNGPLHNSSLSKKFSFSLEKISKSLIFKASSKCKQLKSEVISYKSSLDLHQFNLKIGPAYDKIIIHEKKPNSSHMKALLKLTLKNGIPSFKLVIDNSNDILTAAVEKLPSGKDDTSLTYTFYSVHDIKNKNGDCRKQDSTDSRFGYNGVGNMKISSSYRAEFSELERDLFVVRESVLYGPDLTRSDCMKTIELAAVIVKNSSKESYGGLGSSKSTVVILPGGSHSLPNSGQPSSLTDRWRSGGLCDCGGWDVGCELKVLTNQNEMTETSNPSTTNRLDLCYQGRHEKKHGFSLAQLENGFYSLEYNATSMSSLQAFSICVAVISSQNLTHIFQVNHLQDANTPIITRHRKVKSQTSVYPPV